jgi:2-hydroxychromene-2-carboxylate isomerase
MATWLIDPDVRRIAKRFAGASASFPKLIAAVVKAEGNIVRAVQCSEPGVTAKEKSLEITARSAVHAMSDFIFADPTRRAAFVEAFGATWAPRGVANDPHDLNANWPRNVLKLWA